MPKKTSIDDALSELGSSKTLTGKYAPVFRDAEKHLNEPDDALLYEEFEGKDITQTEVQGMRSYLDRHAKDKYRVRSKKVSDEPEQYKVVVHLRRSD